MVMEEATQTSPVHNDILGVTLPPPQSTNTSEESISILKNQIEELLGKEKAWEEERTSFKELIVNLQEDRSFYKDVSQQKHEELGSLQSEMLKLHKDVLLLQKDVGVINDSGKPFCNQCTQNSSVKNNRSVKSKSKTLMRSSKSLPKSQNEKRGNSSLSPSETPTPTSHRARALKTIEKCSTILKGNTISSSASSSCSNSAKTTPVHLDGIKNGSSSPNTLKSSESISAEEKTPTSPVKSETSISDVHTKHKLLSKLSSRSIFAQSHVATQIPFSLPNSPASLKSTLFSAKSIQSSISCKSQPLSAIANSTKSSVSLQSPKMKSNHSALAKSSSVASPKSYPVVGKSKATNATKLHRSVSLSPRKLPVKFQASIAKPFISQKHQNSSTNSILSTSSTLEKVTSLDKENEEFFLTCDLHSKISNEEDIEVANEILKDLDESGLGDSVIKQYAETLVSGVDGEASILGNSPKQTNSSSSSISKASNSASAKSNNSKNHCSGEELKEKHHLEESLIAIFESHLVRSTKLKVINPKWKSIVSPQRRKLLKKKVREKGESSLSTDQSQETEEEIEEMMSLLEAHVARNAYLAIVNADNEASTS